MNALLCHHLRRCVFGKTCSNFYCTSFSQQSAQHISANSPVEKHRRPIVPRDVVEDDEPGKLVKPGRKHSVLWYETQLQKLGDGRNLSKAIHLVDVKLKEDRLEPSYYILHKLISICSRVGHVEKVFHVLHQMKRIGFKPRDKTYTVAFNACAECPDKSLGLEKAHQLRQMLSNQSSADGGALIDINLIIYKAMIRAFGRCGDIHTAFSIMDEVLEKFKQPSVECYGALLHACIEQTEGGFFYAWKVWQKMISMKIKPDINTINLILRAARDCSMLEPDASKPKVKKSISSETKTAAAITGNSDNQQNNQLTVVPNEQPSVSGNVPTEFSVNSNVPSGRLALLGGIGGVLALCSAMETKPSLKTVSLLVQLCDPKDEELIFEAVRTNDLKLDVNFFNLLISKLNRQHRLDEANLMLQKMEECSIKPNLHTYGALAMGCFDQKSASNLLQQLAGKQLVPSVELFNILIFNSRLNFPYKRFVLIEMIKLGIRPTKATVTLVEKSLVVAKKSILSRKRESDNVATLSNSERKRQQGFGRRYEDFSKFYTDWLRRTPIASDSDDPLAAFKSESTESEEIIEPTSAEDEELKAVDFVSDSARRRN